MPTIVSVVESSSVGDGVRGDDGSEGDAEAGIDGEMAYTPRVYDERSMRSRVSDERGFAHDISGVAKALLMKA